MTYFGEDHDGLLFFRMPTECYDSVHFQLHSIFYSHVYSMGLDGTMLGGVFKQDDGTEKSKEGNSVILPGPQRRSDEGKFPALAIECGNSESLPRLYQDQDWWFDNSPPGGPRAMSEVVLTVNIDPRACRFLIELWHRDHDNVPTQSVTISAKDPRAVLVQATGLAVPLGHSRGPA